MHLHLRRRASVAVFIALTALIFGCSASKTTAPVVDNNAVLVQKVESILTKDAASADDVNFLTGLSAQQREYVWNYYGEHPRPMSTASRRIPQAMRIESTLPPSSATATSWVGEEIESGYGWPGTRATAAYLTSLCGGDIDYMFLYSTIPNAYNDRARLRGRTVDPVVLGAIVFAFNGKLSARVYTNGYVYVCVGKGIDRLGLNASSWNNAFGIVKT